MREITLKEFQHYLNRGITSTTLSRALNRAGIIVENDAKKRCPVGKTGLLRASIKHRLEGKDTCIVGTTMDYAP